MVSLRAPLFVPASRPDRFAKAAASGTDAVILDLEDAVAARDKIGARAHLGTPLPGTRLIVRVNAADTDWHAGDIAALRHIAVAAVMLPKAQSASDLTMLERVLGRDVAVIALVETAAGLAAARDLARHPMIRQLAFGSVDYCADLGCDPSREALLSARSELVLASRLAGIAPPLDGVTTDLSDAGAAADEARHARSLGMGGKMCIHPAQVPAVTQAFLPTARDIDWARRVLAAGDGAVAIEGEMVDAPVRRRAEAILAAMGDEQLPPDR